MGLAEMDGFEFEGIERYFNDGPSNHATSGPLAGEAKRLKLVRSPELTLYIEVEEDGWAADDRITAIPGSFSRRDDETEIILTLVGMARVKGLVNHGSSTNGRSGRMVTTTRFSIHSIQMQFDHNHGTTAYTIEWIDNLPSSFIWPHLIKIRSETKVDRLIDWKAGSLEICRQSEGSGSSWAAMHLSLDGIELTIVCNTSKQQGKERTGSIIYTGECVESHRDKIRDTLSFLFGRPLVYLGCTAYNDRWYALSANAITPMTMDGRAFRMHSLPPFPIFKPPYENMLAAERFEAAATAILRRYDELNFQYVSWSYWHAMCSPYHMEAVHFGALIEHLQSRILALTSAKVDPHLIDRIKWKHIRSEIDKLLAQASIEADTLTTIRDNIARGNNAPQKVVLRRIMSSLSLAFENPEIEAWNQRNDAAHGEFSNDYTRIILNNKILRILVHRLIAGITECSDRYRDYYSLNFPFRDVRSGVERRADHPEKGD